MSFPQQTDWNYLPFSETIRKVPKSRKIPRKQFLEGGKYPIISQEEAFINGYWNNTDDVLQIERPIILFGDHTKVLKYVNFDFVLGADGVKVLNPIDRFTPKFFFYALLSINLRDLGYARHFRLLKEQTIPVPPLAEQERIVAILDEAFESIATATAHTQQKLQNAQELFQSTLQSAFSGNGELRTKNEALVELITFAEHITDGDHQAPPKSAEGIPFITISNIQKNTRKINFSDTFYVPVEYYLGLKEHRRPRKCDVLYTVTGSFGIPVLVTSEQQFCFQRHIALIRPNNKALSSWISYALLSPQLYEQASNRATGTAQKTVSLKTLRSLLLPNHNLPTQRAIVKKLDALSAETRQLESHYQKQLTAYTELKQSLLQQAFSGKL